VLAIRGADLSIVWPEILVTAVIGSVYFAFALYRCTASAASFSVVE